MFVTPPKHQSHRAIYVPGSVLGAAHSSAQASTGDRGGGGAPGIQVSSVCHPGTQCVDHPLASNNDLLFLGSVWNTQHYRSLYQLYFLHLPAVRSGHVPLDQQGRGGHVSSGHVTIIPFPVMILHVTQISVNAFCTVPCLCLCCYCCFYNSINMMLFCHPIVSELCIMCRALFRSLQFPLLNMVPGQTVIILQMARGQQPANGMFVLINCLAIERRRTVSSYIYRNRIVSRFS